MLTLLLLSLYIQVSVGWNIWVSNGGSAGVWSSTTFCPPRSLATGMRIKVERKFLTDNTGVNRIDLFCTIPPSENVVAVISSGPGDFGVVGNEFMCDPGTYITAFCQKVENSAIDSMGITNIKIKCSNGKILELDGTRWGDWGVWSDECTYGANGIATKDQIYLGWDHDDTEVNDMRLSCNPSPLFQ